MTIHARNAWEVKNKHSNASYQPSFIDAAYDAGLMIKNIGRTERTTALTGLICLTSLNTAALRHSCITCWLSTCQTSSHNDEHRSNQIASDPANPLIWLADCIDNGLWLGSEKWKGRYAPNGAEKMLQGALPIEDELGGSKMLPAFLESAYMAWAEGRGSHVQAAPKAKLWGVLTEIGFAPIKTGGVRHRIVPSVDKIRAALDAQI